MGYGSMLMTSLWLCVATLSQHPVTSRPQHPRLQLLSEFEPGNGNNVAVEQVPKSVVNPEVVDNEPDELLSLAALAQRLRGSDGDFTIGVQWNPDEMVGESYPEGYPVKIATDNHDVVRRRFDDDDVNSVLPPWKEFCRMLHLAECGRFKRHLLNRA